MMKQRMGEVVWWSLRREGEYLQIRRITMRMRT
jgi:hypothetical protein